MMSPNQSELGLLQECFKEYYFNNFDHINIPDKINQREFGYKKFNTEGMIRHVSVSDFKQLRLLLMKEIPSDVFCSNACYSFPNLPMSEKDWLEADLIFDIDAKDLKLSCRDGHTCVRCTNCNHVELKSESSMHSGSKENNTKANCSSCGSENAKWEEVSVTCKNCINESKKQLSRLVEVLTDDLGIDRESVSVYFSGNEGFHVHVSDSQYNVLASKERADLADYIRFNGAIPETFGIRKNSSSGSGSGGTKWRMYKATDDLPQLDEGGWRGRVAKQVFGSKSKRPAVASHILSSGYQAFARQLESIREEIGVRIDPSVTMDIHRIFRLGGSINSKSGLAKIVTNDVSKFDPFTDACQISDEDAKVTLVASLPVQITLKRKKFGPYHNEKLCLPKYAAVYLICKGLARVAQ